MKYESLTREAINRMIVTPRKTIVSHLKAYLEANNCCQDKTAINKLYDSILEATFKKLNKIKRAKVATIEGLQFVYATPRPVTIIYDDTDEVEEITTIPQMAIVGKVYYQSGEKVTLTQSWVGRVFPQWKALTTHIRY